MLQDFPNLKTARLCKNSGNMNYDFMFKYLMEDFYYSFLALNMEKTIYTEAVS